MAVMSIAKMQIIMCSLFGAILYEPTGFERYKTMFDASKHNFQRFENKVWLSSPTMHGHEIEYVTEAYQTNWMSTVGKNINVVEEEITDKVGVKYAVGLSCGTALLHLAMKLAGEKIYGQPKQDFGTQRIESRNTNCRTMVKIRASSKRTEHWII